MKAGIITFHRALNYGAVLQAYALQQFLDQIGIENEIIDYRCNFIEEFYKPIKATPFGNPKMFTREVLYAPKNLRKRRRFEEFIGQHVRTSRVVHTSDELRQMNSEFDFFITGSDQVWNMKWSGFDTAYFLDFADDQKKYSYAASFGLGGIQESQKETYHKLLHSFRELSVRENTGVKIIQGLLQRGAAVHIDPTCLIEKSQWEKISIKPKESGYVLVYMLDKSAELLNYAESIAKERNMKIIRILDTIQKDGKYEDRGFLSPAEFLGLFANAGYIVTNSFHGLMFSTIFEKDFCLQYQKREDAPNSRLQDFVKAYGLESHVMDAGAVREHETDYLFVKQKYQEERERTQSYFLQIGQTVQQKRVALPKSKDQCCGCRACEQVCPKKAIIMEQDEEGFFYPAIDFSRCVSCGRCERVCAFQVDKRPNTPSAPKGSYIAYINDDQKRRSSRSGGVYVAVTDAVLHDNGVVYGARLQKDMTVTHSRAEIPAERDTQCNSKYVQSDTCDSFTRAAEDLRNGKNVVYSGTSCQIAAFKSFLALEKVNYDIEQLVTIDIVCHGVMSPKLWKDNLDEIAEKYASDIVNANFRDKGFGWDSHIETYQLQDEKRVQSTRYTSVFYCHRGLRPCCYVCPYTSVERKADITLADAWGIKKVQPTWDAEKGVSFILVHTPEGERMINNIRDVLTIQKVDFKKMLQPNLQAPTQRPSDRERFWKSYRENGYSYIADQCAKEQERLKCRNKVKATIAKCLRRLQIKRRRRNVVG